MRLAIRGRSEQPGDDDSEERARSLRARRLVSFDSASPEVEPLSARLYDSNAPPADEVAEHNAQQVRLITAISVLPPRQRTAIELGLFEGFSLREIGDRMGISESRVCQLQKRAVQHLQKVISDAPVPYYAA
jgi:RNA polymerase sigma factor (sigma-70 family)